MPHVHWEVGNGGISQTGGPGCSAVCQVQNVLGSFHMPMSAELGGSAPALYVVPAKLRTRRAEGVSEILHS